MVFQQHRIKIKTRPGKFVNLTLQIEKAVEVAATAAGAAERTKTGICSVWVPGSTGAILVNEADPMLLEDFRQKLEDIVPSGGLYHHPENAHSHIRAGLLGPGKTIPIVDGKLALGTWQEILFYEADTRPRDREIIIIITVLGEEG